MMEGRYATAMDAAVDLENEIPPAFLSEFVKLADAFMPTKLHVMIRFGKWNDVLAVPAPPEHRLVSRAMRHYARSVAYASLGKPAEARREMGEFDKVAAQIDETWMVGQNFAPDVMKVTRNVMEGEILYREGDYDTAFAKLREAVKGEEALRYDEPPGWMQPVRHALGALLIEQGRYKEAAEEYRKDLVRHPANGWSLLGLELALKLQDEPGNAAELAKVSAERTKVWKRADVTPNASCYCAAGAAD
jgi:tetratricopeptide (TPR) repeat protein